MKIKCRSCERILDSLSFYECKTNITGRQGTCKQCRHDQQILYKSLNRERINEKKRIYRGGIREEINKKQNEARAKNPNRVREQGIKYRKQYPEKTVARDTLNNALKSGILIRKPCTICGNKKSQAHHESYLKGDHLKVVWLCAKHHAERHMEINRKALL